MIATAVACVIAKSRVTPATTDQGLIVVTGKFAVINPPITITIDGVKLNQSHRL